MYIIIYVHTWALTLTHNTHTVSRYRHSSFLSHTDTLWAVHEEHHHLRGVREVAYTQHTATHNQQQNTQQHATTEQHTIEQYTTHCQQVLHMQSGV